MRKVSMTARDELLNALARRYAVAGAPRRHAFDEFDCNHRLSPKARDAAAAVRRHRAPLGGEGQSADLRRGGLRGDRVLWEASDRICGKRLKALMPTLVEAMERHGHMRLGPQIRAAVLAMSASTIDRSLRQVREQASGSKRRRTAAPSSVRKSIPVRTFSDWDDPPPGFVEADLVAHCGPVARELRADAYCHRSRHRMDRVRSVPRTDPAREVLGEVRRRLPFERSNTDNDSV